MTWGLKYKVTCERGIFRYGQGTESLISSFLSLYSTATQNTLRWGLALGSAPDARILRWGYQHVGILEPTQTLKFALPPTPNPNASHWNIGLVGTQRKILALAMYISCFLCRFHLRLVANANPISGGIWALKVSHMVFEPTILTSRVSVYGYGENGQPWW